MLEINLTVNYIESFLSMVSEKDIITNENILDNKYEIVFGLENVTDGNNFDGNSSMPRHNK